MSWGLTWSCSTNTDIILMNALAHAVIERGPLSVFLGSGCLVGLIEPRSMYSPCKIFSIASLSTEACRGRAKDEMTYSPRFCRPLGDLCVSTAGCEGVEMEFSSSSRRRSRSRMALPGLLPAEAWALPGVILQELPGVCWTGGRSLASGAEVEVPALVGVYRLGARR